MPQYFKLKRKLDNGAQFLITQTGFDSRKFDELLRYMEMRGMEAPVMANVFVLTPNVARYFHKEMVPGVSLSDELMAECEKQATSPDAGQGLLPRVRREADRHLRRASATGAPTSPAPDLRGVRVDLQHGRVVRRERLARVRARDAVRAKAALLPALARLDDRPEPARAERRVPGLDLAGGPAQAALASADPCTGSTASSTA